MSDAAVIETALPRTQGDDMRRIIVSFIATLAAASFGGAFAAAADASRASNAFSSTTATPTELLGLGTGAPRPELCEAATTECLVAFIGYDRLTGAIEGSQVNTGSLSINFATGTGWAVSLAHFTGTVRGCSGAGTATIRYDVRLGAQPGRNIGTFTVVEGSGKVGLSGLSGGGTLTATPSPTDGTVPSKGRARLPCTER